MATDPIGPVVTALQTLATPQGTAGDVNSYKTGIATGDATIDPALKALMQVLYAASPDMKTVGASMTTALTDVAGVIDAIAGQVAALSAIANIGDAMTNLQSGLALAQTLAPSSSAVVLNSAGTLFSQVQQLLTAVPDPKTAAIELYSLAQQLTFISTLVAP